jgi:hypothetical protein
MSQRAKRRVSADGSEVVEDAPAPLLPASIRAVRPIWWVGLALLWYAAYVLMCAQQTDDSSWGDILRCALLNGIVNAVFVGLVAGVVLLVVFFLRGTRNLRR